MAIAQKYAAVQLVALSVSLNIREEVTSGRSAHHSSKKGYQFFACHAPCVSLARMNAVIITSNHYCPGIEGWHAGFAQCLLGVDAWEEM